MSRLSIELCNLPAAASQRDLSGKSAVAVDVLRAATTITTALTHGATRVVPCEEIEAARSTAAQLRANHPAVLLGGERQGQAIAGFDLDNSPASYAPQVVADQTIVFTSTNGTRALAACRDARRVMMGSFVNLSAVGEFLVQQARPIVIVCAGTDGQPTLEDMLFGGALCQLLSQGFKLRLDPSARGCQTMWETAQRQIATGTSLAGILAQTTGGQNVARLGLQADIEFAAQVDHFNIVPCLDASGGLVAGDVDHPGHHR